MTLLGEVCGCDVERVTYEQSRKAFEWGLARTRSRPADLGVRAAREDALHVEVRAVLPGRAIPDEPGSTYIAGPSGERRLSRLTDAGYSRIRGGRKGVGKAGAKSLLTIAERLERHSAAELEKAFPEPAAAESIRRLRQGHLPRGFDNFAHFAGDVDGWLEFSGYQGDLEARARDLPSRAAIALLDVGRVEQAERVIRNVRSADMLLNALYIEKCGRTEEAASLNERAGSSGDANRVRADVLKDRFQRFERRGSIASSNICRLSSDEGRLIRAAPRAVP